MAEDNPHTNEGHYAEVKRCYLDVSVDGIIYCLGEFSRLNQSSIRDPINRGVIWNAEDERGKAIGDLSEAIFLNPNIHTGEQPVETEPEYSEK